MAKQTRTTLKTYFESGDIPTQANYSDLIDSNLNLSDESRQIIVSEVSASSFAAENHISASGNIEATSYISASEFRTTGPITASGDISSSSNIILDQTITYGNTDASLVAPNDLTIDAAGDIALSVDGDQITMDDGTTTYFTFNVDSTPEIDIVGDLIIDPSGGNTSFDSHITASGDISASYTSTGSFGSVMLTNLPTVEPLVTGALWVSGSGGGAATGSKYLMVFTG